MMSAEQHEHQREVERREPGGVPDGKAAKIAAPADDEPHLVAVPERPDRVDGDPPLGVGLADEHVQGADAEVEPLEHEEAGPEDGDDDEPDDLQSHDRPPQ